MNISRLGLPFILLALIAICLLMFTFPQSSWDAAVRGLSIWWDVLFPSLFPFFVISEVLLGFGIVHFLGKLLDPFMKPAFRIPGSGGFVAAMGFAAGYPVSARLTVKLREQKLISRVEGERLVSFTTSSDPIFLIGAVSVGFFHNPRLAGVLALAHYGGSVIMGFLMRFYKSKDGETAEPEGSQNGSMKDGITNPGTSSGKAPRVPRLKAAVLAMHEARIADGRELGQLLRQAILTSLRLMTVVGGLVVFFSVFLEILSASGVMAILYEGLQKLLPLLGLPSALAEPFMSGLFEVTLGAKNAAATASSVPLAFKAAAAAFILSWGGLSVHAQVASILNATDMRYTPFLIARSIHAILSALLLLLLWPFFGPDSSAAPVFADGGNQVSNYAWQASAGNLGYGIKLLAVMFILSILAILIQRFRPKKMNRNPLR